MSGKLSSQTGGATQATALKRGGGARHVYEALRNDILELSLAPCDALDETTLAERFRLSRSPVREALVRLSAEGFVRTLSNRSTIVAPLDIREVPRYIEALDYLQRAVTRLAARNRSVDDLTAMHAAAEVYDQTCENGTPLEMSRANKDFHMAIAAAGRNSYLANAYGRLLDEGRRLLHLHYARRSDTDDPFPLSPEHYQMIEAIREKDEAESDSLAHAHTRVFHQRLQDFAPVEYIEEL